MKIIEVSWNEAVAELMIEAGSKYSWIDDERLIANTGFGNLFSSWLVAMDEETKTSMGKLRVFAIDGVGMISHVYTRPAFRNQKVATALISEAKKIFLGCPKPFLLTASVIDGGHSCRAFLANGFKVLTGSDMGRREVMVGWSPF